MVWRPLSLDAALSDRYRIERELGREGWPFVYEAMTLMMP
jgi:hypothetical protein